MREHEKKLKKGGPIPLNKKRTRKTCDGYIAITNRFDLEDSPFPGDCIKGMIQGFTVDKNIKSSESIFTP